MKTILWYVLKFIILVLLPNVVLGQAPELGTATNFALFTTVGAFGSVGSTDITGDVGTNAGAFTGFPDGTVTGSVYIADTTSARAAADIETAYNNLTDMPCGFALAASLGGNQVLAPNTYCIDAASTLNGDLILDGQGDSNALFIIKINGAFSTGTSSNVVLINSTSMCNVYWQVNGAFDLGSYSAFRGTVIANGAFSLQESSSLQGRGFSRVGAISLTNNMVAMNGNNCADMPITLPVELLSFNASCNNEQVDLTWSTASEINNDYFSIEYSNDGTSWQVIGKVDGAGSSSSVRNYSFTDIAPLPDNSYYRLKQTDYDGKFKYLKVSVVKNCGDNLTEWHIYSDPANGIFNLSFKEDKGQLYSMSIYNVLGKKVYGSESYESVIDLSQEANGIYFLYFTLASKVIVKKLVIAK